MRSATWQGDWPASQPYGCTELTVEPWYARRGCHWHCGVDIAMPDGTPLYAARSGLVTHRTLGILGIAVAGREVDYYIHGRYPVLLGAQIKQGQAIGTSGNVMPGGGYTTGAHLHFERQGPGGVVNEPSTSRDPMMVLQTHGGIGDSISDEMTPADQAYFDAKFDLLRQGQVGGRDQILAAIKLVAVAGGALNAAQQAELDNILATVQKIDRGE